MDVVTIHDSQIPVLGMNTGRLGFLLITRRKMLLAHLFAFDQKYEIDKRSLIEFQSNQGLFKNENYALNEVTIHKKDSSSMVTIDATVNGQYLNSYWADGLIILTNRINRLFIELRRSNIGARIKQFRNNTDCSAQFECKAIHRG